MLLVGVNHEFVRMIHVLEKGILPRKAGNMFRDLKDKNVSLYLSSPLWFSRQAASRPDASIATK
jgi:hypothetical protein